MGEVVHLPCPTPPQVPAPAVPVAGVPEGASRWRPLGGSICTAVQVTAGNLAALAEWVPDSALVGGGLLIRQSSATRVTAYPGDWVIRHPRGIFLKLTDRAFRADFAEADTDPTEGRA